MKIKDLQVDGKFSVDDLRVDKQLTFTTENGYVVSLPTNLNWFQRLLYKLLGFKVTKNGDN